METRYKAAAILLLASCARVMPALAATAGAPGTPDIADFQRAKITLDQAISAAEKAANGTAMDAVFETTNGKSGYAVTVLANSTPKQLWVDPQSDAAAVESKISAADQQKLDLDKATFADLHSAKSTLEDAVSIAERHSGAKAIDAKIDKRNDKLEYTVQVVRDGKLDSIRVDPVRGEVIALRAKAGDRPA